MDVQCWAPKKNLPMHTQDAIWKSCCEQWKIVRYDEREREREREKEREREIVYGKSMVAVWHDDDDDDGRLFKQVFIGFTNAIEINFFRVDLTEQINASHFQNRTNIINIKGKYVYSEDKILYPFWHFDNIDHGTFICFLSIKVLFSEEIDCEIVETLLIDPSSHRLNIK